MVMLSYATCIYPPAHSASTGTGTDNYIHRYSNSLIHNTHPNPCLVVWTRIVLSSNSNSIESILIVHPPTIEPWQGWLQLLLIRLSKGPFQAPWRRWCCCYYFRCRILNWIQSQKTPGQSLQKSELPIPSKKVERRS
jgi:hypothetical protein